MKTNKVVLIGISYMAEALYHWMEHSTELFDILTIILEDECPPSLQKKFKILSVKDVICDDLLKADKIFICYPNTATCYNFLLQCGIPAEKLLSGSSISDLMNAEEKMNYYEALTRGEYSKLYNNPHAKVGAFTYGAPILWYWKENEQIIIGKFCSIAQNVQIFSGGEHHTEWNSTYPFNVIIPDSHTVNQPASKGDVIIGNDVWIAHGATILSGVHIGDGAVIGAAALVAKDIPPYAIAVGNPARIIRYRFDDQTIQTFLKIQWWNWKYEHIYAAIPLLQSNRTEELFEYYEKTVRVNSN